MSEIPPVSRATVAPPGRSNQPLEDETAPIGPAQPPPTLRSVVDEMFGPDGAMARAIDHYEPRDGQRAMAAAVAATVERGGTLLAEGDPGTGKTLAYLVPAILSRQRVLISTGTKNLQEQIFFKDLPALQETLPVSFTATLMKGRSNYLCLHRFAQVSDAIRAHARLPLGAGHAAAPGLADRSDLQIFLPIVDEWARQTDTGDRAELQDLPEDLWIKILCEPFLNKWGLKMSDSRWK